MAAARSRLPELSLLLALDAGMAGLLLLFIALATPERMKSGIEGVGGAVDDARDTSRGRSAHTARRCSARRKPDSLLPQSR